MPWKESSIMDERTRFISRLLEGEKMTHVCEEFGISRKTGYKLWNRYQAEGAVGLEEKRPSSPSQSSFDTYFSRKSYFRFKKREIPLGSS